MNILSENAKTVLDSRYLLRNDDGSIIETPEQLFRRVANAMAQAELKFGGDVAETAEKFYRLISSLHFLPNSPTLMNAGTPRQQLSACFVLPVADSLEGIYDTLKYAALIHQSGGGTGFNFSKIRPKDDFLPNSGGTASGPVSFLELYDASTERIKQGGRRRGANMGILNADHPDIETFVNSKFHPGALKNFNISVGVHDAFLEAVEADAMWALIHPNTKKTLREIPARELWNLIIDRAWSTGDPGMIFLDRLQEANPTPQLGVIDTTNPCGEVPLLPFEACNLGSINLSLFVTTAGGKTAVDFALLHETIFTAVRFLDNVVEENHYLLPQIAEVVKGNRKIGLGVMGWAELLIRLEIPYASEEAIALAEQLMRFINETAHEASVLLAKERGAFANWAGSIYSGKEKLRNATCTAIAPTGTIAVIANTSPSIEPLFALAFRRQNVLGNKTLHETNGVVTEFLKAKNVWSEKLQQQVEADGNVENAALPEDIKSLLRTAPFIAPEWHLRHQAAFQQFTDNAVSKTINLPNDATREDIAAIYLRAWKLKVKGITVYRDHCKPEQVMHPGVSCEICVG